MWRKIIHSGSLKLRKLGVNFHEENDSRVRAMRRKIHELGGINFEIQVFSDGAWTAESTNIEGIITGGESGTDQGALIKDAIFTYFEIPPHLCNETLLRGDEEPVQVTQRVYA